jgi:hypothetical protein
MDKVKQILEILRKHHFWILCGLAALASLIAWSMSTGSLATQFQANVGQIEQKIGSLNSPVESHSDWKGIMDKETAAVWDNVNEAWKKLYSNQKDKVYIWPKMLGNDFLQAVEKLEGTKDELKEGLLVRYQNEVLKLVKELPAIIDAESAMDPQQAAPQNGSPAGPDYRVVWQPASQLEIIEGFNWVKAQSTLVVRQAQEELWVYQALLNVIKNTNEGSRGPGDAPVKELANLLIAQSAAEDVPSCNQPRYNDTLSIFDPSGGVGPAPEGSKVPKPALRDRGHDNGGGGDHGFGSVAPTDAGGANPDDKWKNYRYVTLDGKPVMQADLDAGTSEFNLMPFVMVLKIDERDIDRLLVNFRNSALPIEVQQVRINPATTAGVGGIANSRPMGGGGSDHGPAPAIAMAGGGTASGQDRVVAVEIRGVVALVQPPKMPAIQTAQAEPGATPETPPAAAPETPAAPTPETPATTPAPAPAATTPETPTPTPTPAPAGGAG